MILRSNRSEKAFSLRKNKILLNWASLFSKLTISEEYKSEKFSGNMKNNCKHSKFLI